MSSNSDWEIKDRNNWWPTGKLRWVVRKIRRGDQIETILQQEWKRLPGYDPEFKWEDVPEVSELK